MSEHERHEKGSSRRGWWVVLLICACMLGWAMFQYLSIQDAPRQWDFGTLPDVPGESVYSTSRPARAASAPSQAGPLPEAATGVLLRPEAATRPTSTNAPGGAGDRP